VSVRPKLLKSLWLKCYTWGLYAKFDETDSDLYLANIKSNSPPPPLFNGASLESCMAWTNASVYLHSFYVKLSTSCGIIIPLHNYCRSGSKSVKERTSFPKTRLGKEATTMASKELKKDFVSCSAPHPVKLLAVCIQTALQRFTLSRIIELRGSVVSSLHSYFGGPGSKCLFIFRRGVRTYMTLISPRNCWNDSTTLKYATTASLHDLLNSSDTSYHIFWHHITLVVLGRCWINPELKLFSEQLNRQYIYITSTIQNTNI
jgi:hypothetical protein